MDNDTTFRTKTGYCHVLPDKIVLNREGVLGDIAKKAVGDNIIKILVIYGLLSLYFLYRAYTDFVLGKVVFSTLYFGCGAFLIYGIINSLTNSATPVIDRGTIQKVEFTPATRWFTRAYFTVFFEQNGKLKKRLIMLPGSMSGGQEETEKALAIMKAQGLM